MGHVPSANVVSVDAVVPVGFGEVVLKFVMVDGKFLVVTREFLEVVINFFVAVVTEEVSLIAIAWMCAYSAKA